MLDGLEVSLDTVAVTAILITVYSTPCLNFMK
jgi:hypothetical protein